MNRKEPVISNRNKNWIISGAFVAALVSALIFSLVRVDVYGGTPDLLIGRWAEVLDGHIHRMHVGHDRVTLFSRNGKSQTCYVKKVFVSNNLFGAGGKIEVLCKAARASNSPLWTCYEPGLTADYYTASLIFKSKDVSFNEADVYSQNFLRCDKRDNIGLWQRR